MSTFKLNLTINQGSTFSKAVTWKTGTPPLPVNLVGCAARMQVRSKVNSDVVLLSFTTENGGIVLGGVAGTITFAKLTATETAAITWLSAVYDLEIVFADNTVQRKIAGSITISPEVTRVV